MKLMIGLLLCLLLWVCTPASALASSTASDAAAGKRDLQQWHPLEDGAVTLDAPWQLYWNRLLAPTDFDFAHGSQAPELTVSIPAQWKSYTLDGQPLSNEGYATYRLIFTLSETAASQPLGLYVNNVATSYRFWINGKLTGGIGTVGSDASHSVPRNYPNTYFFTAKPGDNEILIQVSNFAQRTGGIWESIELGEAGQIASKYRNRVMVWTFIAGSLLLMSVFSIFLYLFRKKERAALWFGFICLAVCIRSSLLGESYAYVLLPSLSWEWGVKLEYLSEIVTIVSVAAFVNKQYPQDTIRAVFPVFTGLLSGFACFVIAAPAKMYTQYMVPYVILLLLPVFLYVMSVYIRAALRKRVGSGANTLGFVVFFASIIHEVLYYTGFVSFGGLVSFGLLLFLLSQLLNVSLMFTRAVTQSERLSAELNQVIESQEETIRQRTSSLQQLNAQLEQGNRELTRIEHVRSTVMAEAYHDLSTPITSIKGFSKAIMNDVIPAEEAPVYAKRIYDRSLILEKLIDSVVEFIQLKTGEVHFQLEDIALVPYVSRLCQTYEAEARAQRIALFWEEPQLAWTGTPSQQILVTVDPFQLERVFANLVSNAVKYSPEGSVIHVGLEYEPPADAHDGRVMIHVADTGIGIPESELPHIFKRRYRIPGTDPAKKGSGLGLAICAEIIAQHGGSIDVASKLGAGSVFTISIPANVRIRSVHASEARPAEGGG
ncbi:MAG: resE [Paenibacillus sp.]|nr:resE [Paenibacillus sp.]